MNFMTPQAEAGARGFLIQHQRVGVVGLKHGIDGPTLNRAFRVPQEYEGEISRLLAEPLPKAAKTGVNHNLLLLDSHERTAEALGIHSSYTLSGKLLFGPNRAGERRYFAYSNAEEVALVERLTSQLRELVGDGSNEEALNLRYEVQLLNAHMDVERVTRLSGSMILYDRGVGSMAIKTKRAD